MGSDRTRRKKPHKNNQKRATIRRWVLVLLTVPLLSFWVYSHHRSHENSVENPPPDSSLLPWYWNSSDAGALSASASGADRPVYPYSVIPGGVVSAKELRATLRQDALVAQHYSGFQAQHARVIHLAQERHVYVSYRFGDRIFWTAKKVTIPAGETLLTDGAHFARTRCGNRISEVPAKPVSPVEPMERELDNPLWPRSPVLTSDSSLPEPIWPDSPVPIAFLPPGPLQPGVPGGEGPGVPFFPPIPCCGSSNQPPSTPPVVATPEPSAFVLLAICLGCFFLLSLFRQR